MCIVRCLCVCVCVCDYATWSKGTRTAALRSLSPCGAHSLGASADSRVQIQPSAKLAEMSHVRHWRAWPMLVRSRACPYMDMLIRSGANTERILQAKICIYIGPNPVMASPQRPHGHLKEQKGRSVR